MTAKQKLKQLVLLAAGGSGVFTFACVYGGEETFYSRVVMPVAHKIVEPENAHNLVVWAAKHRLLPCEKNLKGSRVTDVDLSTHAFGLTFSNPVGMAAGFDKHCEAVRGLQDVGFGFVEVGSVTPKEQEGNEKPRVFRLTEEEAVINRYGFNSVGHDVVLDRMSNLESSLASSFRIGVNLGKNKTSSDPVADYVQGVEQFSDVADYIVVNVSSPNTPGLRGLQKSGHLETLISAVVHARDKQVEKHKERKHLPILLKVAPDLTEEEKKDIADVIRKEKCRIDGLIVSNTTVSRPDSLLSENKKETGGLSGRPLRDLATSTVSDFYRLTNGSVPIIGVGGISSGQDAYEKIRAGASLVQIYTSFVYHGPPVVKKIKRELGEVLRRDGFKEVRDAVGADHRKS